MDLSNAFDTVHHGLLLERLRKIGIPNDILMLIGNWITGRQAQVDIAGTHSNTYKIGSGTTQGSVLGPILVAMFLRPVLDFIGLESYADDNYLMVAAKYTTELLNEIQKKSNALSLWFRSSGLAINLGKTEFIIFSHDQLAEESLDILGTKITSRKQMNILGILFDKILKFDGQMETAITKLKRPLQNSSYTMKN